ncbi:50S ribosomal protein L35 [Candidatus Parcubacteria bacterium]|nr:50S ribosomal protein L35 [Patescibacteria group bacterium]MBU4466692.1 50S ribosomal protein L35 [Patescibacteria group bacterium]MCG2688138.1 50S ribosomal protein L35 [Candidatus Parcubacteria bacterium]
MRKSIKKRLKITKTGKVLRRQSGINHYLAKKSGQAKRRKRKMVPLSKGEFKRIKKLINA